MHRPPQESERREKRAFAIRDLDGSWLCPQGLVHTIETGVLRWGAGKQGTSTELLTFRSDRQDKHGPNHFSVGQRKRKGSTPSTLRRCILRSSCTLQWTSPRMAETWQRFRPNVAIAKTVTLVIADGTVVKSINASSITNVEKLRSTAWMHAITRFSCPLEDVSLTVDPTGQVLNDESDFFSSEETITLKVSTNLADLIACNGLHLVSSGESSFDMSLSGVFTLRQLFASVAHHTRRPISFVSLFQLANGTREEMLPHHGFVTRETLQVEVCLRATVAEIWSSNRLILVDTHGQQMQPDLSTAHTLDDLRAGIGRHTMRPSRFVRFLVAPENTLELKQWDTARLLQTEKVTLTVQLAPTIAELIGRHDVQITSGLSGNPIPLDADIHSKLVSIQDLREAIASHYHVRATGVQLLLALGKQLWDSEPFDLCDIPTGETISVFVRDLGLCKQGQHDEMTFHNNGYNDRVCIHCGPTHFMEGRTQEPKRRFEW
eukprot:TRINITY_DN105125_c0_g1_i1.p1 TRINITY_DN105125_c0_g1~~TRINITY_DN105125_c0_g1_i1.p1  ORF type:complete len:490 (-),score=55.09 TRINITY_DN105125_c0_g1_i1:116-1585(-)